MKSSIGKGITLHYRLQQKVNEGDGCVAQMGDRFRDYTTEKIYTVIGTTKEGTVILSDEEGSGRH